MCLQTLTPLRRTVLLIAAIGVAGCGDASPSPKGKPAERIVSLIELIVTPEKYDGVSISVSGFLSSMGLLSLTREYAAMLDVGAVPVIDQTSDGFLINHCFDSYAVVEGTFRSSRRLGWPPSEVGDYVL